MTAQHGELPGRAEPARSVPCAGGIVRDDAGLLLLIRRGRPPEQGRWSVPGGRCLPGEAPQDACVREVAEETGLAVRVERHVGQVLRPGPDGSTYVIDDFLCTALGGRLRAGDDADEARWVGPGDLPGLPLTSGLLQALTDWGLLTA